jgi:predicted N-acetyltransferase YhbS
MQHESRVQLICHHQGALRLRLGLGPALKPVMALHQLQNLLNQHSFWAQNRDIGQLSQMLRCSSVCVSAWNHDTMIGFGRATSDEVFRAVLWDVLVANEEQGKGLGAQIVQLMLKSPKLISVERIYLMTSNSSKFYEKLGFIDVGNQKLMLLKSG